MISVFIAMFALMGCIIAAIGIINANIDRRPKGAFILALIACLLLFVLCALGYVNG